MAPAPLIHIGVHKTATSWFQADYYPRVRNARFVDRVTTRRALLSGNGYRFDAREARTALGLDDGPRAVLCDEDLSGILHNGGIATTFLAASIAERIKAAAPDADIVIFVREQVSMAAALYHQYVREGGTGGVRRYLFPENYRHLTKVRPFKTPRFDFAQLDYQGLISTYDRLFGRDRVHVFPYEALARDRDRFLEDFATSFGLDLTPATGGRSVNASYRAGTLLLARASNLFTARSVSDKWTILHLPYWYPARKWLLKQVDRVPLLGPRRRAETLLGPEIVAFIRGEFAGINRWLMERSGADLAALGYAIDAPKVSAPKRPAWLKALRN